MRPIVTGEVVWSVCRSVSHDREHYKNRTTNRFGCGLRWVQGSMC